MSLKLETDLIPKLVEDKFDLVKSLYSYNPKGRYVYGQPAFCPFHDNTNTPAAAIYKSVDERPDSLFCFAEQRQYTVVDVLGKLLGYNIYEIGHAIWNEMSDFEKKVFLTTYSRKDYIAQAFQDKPDKQDKPISNEDTSIAEALILFKQNKETLNNTLQKIIGKRGVK